MADQSSGIQWYNGSSVTTGATGIAIGTGTTNTDVIIAVQGSVETDYAAGLARAYAGGSFNDWYLPSIDELNELYLNKATIDATATSNGGAEFSTTILYWSSTEWSSGSARLQDFLDGSQGTGSKNGLKAIRAVRAF